MGLGLPVVCESDHLGVDALYNLGPSCRVEMFEGFVKSPRRFRQLSRESSGGGVRSGAVLDRWFSRRAYRLAGADRVVIL